MRNLFGTQSYDGVRWSVVELSVGTIRCLVAVLHGHMTGLACIGAFKARFTLHVRPVCTCRDTGRIRFVCTYRPLLTRKDRYACRVEICSVSSHSWSLVLVLYLQADRETYRHTNKNIATSPWQD